MNMRALLAALTVTMGPSLTGYTADNVPPNPLIDYPGFLRDAARVGKLREERRISEEEFLRMAADPATVILDARSNEKYQLLHVRGAKNLSLPDITEAELAKVIPTKDTRVLIYCNNNFENEPVALPSKAVRASLNIHTFNTLFSYGYRNVFELGPLLDIRKTKLTLEGSMKQPATAAIFRKEVR